MLKNFGHLTSFELQIDPVDCPLSAEPIHLEQPALQTPLTCRSS